MLRNCCLADVTTYEGVGRKLGFRKILLMSEGFHRTKRMSIVIHAGSKLSIRELKYATIAA
jgi:hypothetical protein